MRKARSSRHQASLELDSGSGKDSVAPQGLNIAPTRVTGEADDTVTTQDANGPSAMMVRSRSRSEYISPAERNFQRGKRQSHLVRSHAQYVLLNSLWEGIPLADFTPWYGPSLETGEHVQWHDGALKTNALRRKFLRYRTRYVSLILLATNTQDGGSVRATVWRGKGFSLHCMSRYTACTT